MADVEDNKDKVEDPQEKNKRSKKGKIHQKGLSKVEKKACLEVKNINNDKKAIENKNANNDKNVGSPTPAVAAFPGFLALVATSFDPLVSIAFSSGLLTHDFVNPSSTNTTDASVAICSSFFSFLVWLSLFSFPARYTTPISPSLKQVPRFISLLLEDDYTV